MNTTNSTVLRLCSEDSDFLLRQHPTPDVTIMGKNIFYDSKIDLTPIFALKKK